MKVIMICFLILTVFNTCKSGAPVGVSSNIEPISEGNTGIAAKYPNDNGIKSDPNVIMADNFEDYTVFSDITKNWSGYFNGWNEYNLKITSDKKKVYSGNKALEIRIPQRDEPLSVGIFKWLEKTQDIVFVRYYMKIDESFNLIRSYHNGISVSSHYYLPDGQATPGIPADGKNKFLTAYETDRGSLQEKSPGRQNIYLYHPEQRDNYGDHLFPTGEVLPFSYKPGDYGASFVSRHDFIPILGRWYCYELMVKANTPGKRDGRITCWVDGTIIADFMNLRLRDTDKLTIDRIDIGIYAEVNPAGETAQYYDNIIIAKSYIGPLIEE